MQLVNGRFGLVHVDTENTRCSGVVNIGKRPFAFQPGVRFIATTRKTNHLGPFDLFEGIEVREAAPQSVESH